MAKAQIIADNDQGAKIVAEALASVLNGKGEYAELVGRESDTNAPVRTAGFHAVLDRHPGLKRVAAQSANWSQAEAFRKTETVSQGHPSLVGIIAGNDTMALGAAAAARGALRPDLRLVGFDGSPDAVAAIKRGEMQATALQPAVVIARMAVYEADRFIKSGSTGKPERQVISCALVTRSNADQYNNFEHIVPASTNK